ncbi:MAG: STELLO glycosyltransferase family protein [Bacteroidota bacterium]
MKSIVITSIFPPTEAVKKFSKLTDYKLIVVGDKKSPPDWQHDNATFLSVKDQESAGFNLSKVLPYNHYCRKMIGYLYSIQEGAKIIVDTDDDNIPKDDWRFPEFDSSFSTTPPDKGFMNIYNYFTSENVWPRGLPLNKITASAKTIFDGMQLKDVKVGIWQGLADEDPDVDAIYRLTSNKPVYFKEKQPVVLEKGTLSPFNTQNTAIREELFTLMYLPTYVTFRFTDILRGLIAQPIMWLYGYRLGFLNATVIQKRNVHDFMKDFESEIPMYQHTEKVIEVTMNSISALDTVENNLFNTYTSLLAEGIVDKREISTLEAWLQDIGKLS